MNYKKIFKISLSIIIIILIILFISYYLNRTNNLEGNVTQTFIKAFSTPQASGEIIYNDYKWSFILPEYTYELSRNDKNVNYLTIVSMNPNTASKKIQDYYYNILPQSGWKFIDQYGSAYSFTNDKINLLSTRQRLMIGIELITFSISE